MARPFTRPSLQPSPLTPRKLAGLDHNRCFAFLRGCGRTRKRRGEREATSRAANTRRLKRRGRIDIEIQEPQNPYVGFVSSLLLQNCASPRPMDIQSVTNTSSHTVCLTSIKLDWLCLPHCLHQTRSPHFTSFTANILILREPSFEAYKRREWVDGFL
jgi:hypothetical protein